MNYEPASDPKDRPPLLGVWLGGIYFLMTAAVFIVTALNTKPGNVGLDWIPFYLLALPWSRIGQAFAIVGVLLNTAFLWALGTVLQIFIRNLRED